MKAISWKLWVVVTLGVLGFYSYKIWLDEDKSELLIGEATHGHFQIELACNACHTEAFGGTEGLQEACVGCHGEDLEKAHDSHPKKKFTDPRNADRIEVLDARYCVSCHTEHQKEKTHAMGLTLPEDYCFHCHQDVGKDRPSHKDLAFDSCASAGCHNYHDNKALYEKFLVENAGGDWLVEHATLASVNADEVLATAMMEQLGLGGAKPEALKTQHQASPHTKDNVHLEAGMACSSCHKAEKESSPNWVEAPGIDSCRQCHVQEAEGYLQGRHGMRLAQGLSPMTPEMSSLNFKPNSLDQAHGCNTCHSAHDFNTQKAAVEACLGCHDDEHSRNYPNSPHGALHQQVLQGELAENQAVTCATCHMPRIEETRSGKKIVRVEHGQNHYLRPNEKMIRPVCMNCHSLEFAIDALADPNLIEMNFSGKPSKHVPSIDWALERDK